MKLTNLLSIASIALVALLPGCATERPLPVYEPPLARADIQSVRTTAYTHTEEDHLQYGNRNALGGTLHAAVAPPAVPAAPVNEPFVGAYQRTEYVAAPPPPPEPIYGSAAADWSRWPAGTVFRVLSTGQLYRVEDYGWALAGRNTIDLYMATRGDMNDWGLRREQIQIVQWGDDRESLRFLKPHQKYRHIRRMVLELEGNQAGAARMR